MGLGAGLGEVGDVGVIAGDPLGHVLQGIERRDDLERVPGGRGRRPGAAAGQGEGSGADAGEERPRLRPEDKNMRIIVNYDVRACQPHRPGAAG